MSIEKFTGKIKKPKKINQVKKGNPLEGFEYHTRPSDLFENGLDYVLNGIFSKEKFGYDIGAGNKKKLRDSFTNDNIQDITKTFMRWYENPRDGESLSKRIAFANKLFVDKD